jgi:hypothetical protein
MIHFRLSRHRSNLGLNLFSPHVGTRSQFPSLSSSCCTCIVFSREFAWFAAGIVLAISYICRMREWSEAKGMGGEPASADHSSSQNFLVDDEPFPLSFLCRAAPFSRLC